MRFSHGIFSGAVVVRRRFGHWAYLLLRSPQGWQFPIAAQGDDEPLPEAMRRQLWESVGMTGLRFYWGHHYFKLHDDAFAAGDGVRFLVGESASGEVGLAAGWLEHRWVAAVVAAEMLPESMRPVLDWADGVLSGADGTPGVKR
jgi:hypothetical protein